MTIVLFILNREMSSSEYRFSALAPKSVVASGRPSILLNTLPKSGSVFVWNTLSQILNYAGCRVSQSTFPVDMIVPEWLNRLSYGNSVAQEHLPASIFNLFQLKKFDCRKFIIHVRDPRQALVSWFHHIEKLYETNSEWLWLLDPALPLDYFKLEREQKIDWLVCHYFHHFVDWIEGWLDAADSGDFDLLFLSQEYLSRDSRRYFRAIIDFYRLDWAYDMLGSLPDPEGGELHFRKGLTLEWMSFFSAEQRECLQRALPARIESKLNAILER